MKKHLTALERMKDQLVQEGLFADVVDAWEVLKLAVQKLPEKPNAKDAAPLGPPLELKDFPQGLAVYADGACRGNPGPGAWGCVAQNHQGEIVFEASGFEQLTTNNKMEIQGAINALALLEQHLQNHPFAPCDPVMFFTDSKYVVEGMNQWTAGWKARGWKKVDGKTPENLELWQELDEMKTRFPKLRVQWVKGHNGHPQNEHCDQLANRLLDAEGF